jgi:ABC-type polysaccharide/polyol phosphate transport system ATPase subunit
VAEGRIEFQHVSKKFRRGEFHDSLRDVIPDLASRMFRRRPNAELDRREFWAVRDVSFSVRPGEALGIIGPNGAGKSTILKLLTGILQPTSGRCGIRGRVGALIEIAGGFHPDLTGGENVYLQGSIRGLKRREIAARFDDIVEFSELGPFINTPVKRYSSGMNARLGFAIAAHMDPDVLVVDEVLAVGDFRFQRKAFERLSRMRAGLPVVLVSHQLERVAALCTHCLLLDRGTVIKRGTPDECISHYVLSGLRADVPDADAGLPYRLDSLEAEPKRPIRSGEWVTLTLRGVVREPPPPQVRLTLRARALHNAQKIFSFDVSRQQPLLSEPGPFEARIELQMNTGNGYFSLETDLWDSLERREIKRGPQALVRVSEPDLIGTTNLHPRVRVLRLPETGEPITAARHAADGGVLTALADVPGEN